MSGNVLGAEDTTLNTIAKRPWNLNHGRKDIRLKIHSFQIISYYIILEGTKCCGGNKLGMKDRGCQKIQGRIRYHRRPLEKLPFEQRSAGGEKMSTENI